ncbi:MAG: secretin N-terminal domain-containing protein, partial [Armatimonadota bacterium]
LQPILPWNQKLVNLNLSSTAIGTVVSILGKQTGINIVLLSKSDEKVTMNVAQMPVGDALKHLAMLAGLRSIKIKNTIVMADEATLKGAYPKEFDLEYNVAPKPEVTDTTKTTTDNAKTTPESVVVDNIQRIYSLKYQGATQLVTSLKEYLATKKVSIVALPNTLLPTVGNAGSNSGSSSNSGGGSSTGASGTAPADSRAKRVLLSGPAAAVQETILILQQMDTPRRQVEITVTIHDVSNDALKDAGVTWDFGQSTISEAVNGNVNVGTFSRTGLSFVGTIHALEQANKAKLLASPNLSVMDGELGSILIGEKRRFPVVTGTTSNGQFIYSTEEQNVGIYMLVASDITEDGTVTLAINAQVSSILGFLQLNGGSYPQISTRESKSTLLLKDGQTMLMGGLLRDEEIVNLQKVPYLSQIPFFGRLFESRKTQKNSSQLLISITPHIIKQQ